MLTLAYDVLMDAVMRRMPPSLSMARSQTTTSCCHQGANAYCLDDFDPTLLKLLSGRLNSACKGIISDRDFVKSFFRHSDPTRASSRRLVPFTLL